ncbi:7939_t:CDS:2 [Funneliformis mosseae]|uniref:7939_t:CDS:1 n=1 Tax=Funneliformis mosseae TaxID=27381 RepID=A0A9N9DMQ5_FUNMO|nr:7939_t:CDS:2 [Funneliformis mosseae]
MAEYILITEYRLAILINNVYIMSREGIWIPTSIPELWLIPTNFSRIYQNGERSRTLYDSSLSASMPQMLMQRTFYLQ